MIDDLSYRSFVVRLWHDPGASGVAWRGEVEHIQSGSVVVVYSLEEACNLIWRSAAEDVGSVGDSSRPGYKLPSSSTHDEPDYSSTKESQHVNACQSQSGDTL